MKYVISLMEDTGSREDWQPKLQIPIDLAEPFADYRARLEFELAVGEQLNALSIIHPYGTFYLHITEAVPEIPDATPADIASAIAGEYPRLASIHDWNEA